LVNRLAALDGAGIALANTATSDGEDERGSGEESDLGEHFDWRM
jgi:hypothetical protein